MKYMEAMSIPNHNYFFFSQPFLGSYKKMRFYVTCETDAETAEKQYLAITYPDRLCFEKTEAKDKTEQRFPFTQEGRDQVLLWLDSQYAQYED